MTRLIIFDLDGTLLNTIQDLGMAANYALELCGYPVHEISAYPFFAYILHQTDSIVISPYRGKEKNSEILL